MLFSSSSDIRSNSSASLSGPGGTAGEEEAAAAAAAAAVPGLPVVAAVAQAAGYRHMPQPQAPLAAQRPTVNRYRNADLIVLSYVRVSLLRHSGVRRELTKFARNLSIILVRYLPISPVVLLSSGPPSLASSDSSSSSSSSSDTRSSSTGFKETTTRFVRTPDN